MKRRAAAIRAAGVASHRRVRAPQAGLLELDVHSAAYVAGHFANWNCWHRFRRARCAPALDSLDPLCYEITPLTDRNRRMRGWRNWQTR